ncbi:hypothetical protein [Streptomyces sp. NPDC023588]|uniref:hypothetical protein n=1 Tax=Streptomyces sp. NPDC023588 TaxID=3154907 RepID=UPI0033D93131
MARSVRVRTLYQHWARFDPATVRYEAKAADLGAEARAVPGGLIRSLVFDRALLVLPLQDVPEGALPARSPDLVAFGAGMIELLWAAGEPLNKAREKAFEPPVQVPLAGKARAEGQASAELRDAGVSAFGGPSGSCAGGGRGARVAEAAAPTDESACVLGRFDGPSGPLGFGCDRGTIVS